VQKTCSRGSQQNYRWDKTTEVAADIEIEEVARKLSPRE
jgi:hypothetical protein